MKVSWSNLPPELWSSVFKHIQSMETLAECRVVCKTWDPFAERAMFSQHLSFRGEKGMVKFCQRLLENPSLRYHIRFLSMGGLQDRPAAFKKDLFTLVMNPSIVSLDGWFDTTSLTNLVDAVKELGEECGKLETLRTWEGESNGGDIYLNAQLCFRASLRELYLSMYTPHTPTYQNVVDHLDQFSNLRKLILSFSDRHVLPELESMLKQCRHLESLYIEVTLGETQQHPISKDDLKQWMISNVQQSSCSLTVDVGHHLHPRLIEYLVFKYPNMHNVTLSGAFTDDQDNISRIVDAVKHVDVIKLEFWYLNSAAEVNQVLSTLKSKSNVVIFRPCTLTYAEGYSIYLDAKKNKDDNTTYCKIALSETRFSEMCNRIVMDIASFPNLKVDYADQDLLLAEDGAALEGTALGDLIGIMSVAVDVCFTCTYIPCPSVPVDALPFQRLMTLKFCGAVLDHNLLALISKFAPQLKNLTFSSCILNPANPQDYHIDMPHTSLGTLSIISGRSIWESYDGMENAEVDYEKHGEALKRISNKISIKQDQRVFVKLTFSLNNLTEHYTLEPGSPTMMRAISKDEYSTCAPGWPNVTIVCKSLEMLKLDLGSLFVELKPSTLMEGVSPWRQTIEADLLKELYSP